METSKTNFNYWLEVSKEEHRTIGHGKRMAFYKINEELKWKMVSYFERRRLLKLWWKEFKKESD